MRTLDNNFYKALGMIEPRVVALLMKTEPDVDKVLAVLPEKDQKVVAGLKDCDLLEPALVYAIKAIVDKQKETRTFCAGWSAAQERAKAAKKIVDKIKFAQTVYALEEDKDETFTAPEIFKPGFEFLTKTEQDVDKLRAALPKEVQNWLVLSNRVTPVTPDLIYAINVYLDMQKLAGKPCICATVETAHECAKAARKLLDDYKRTVDALEDKDETFKATIAALDEELATTKATIAARDEEIMTTKATIAARDEEIMTTKGKLAVCKNELGTKDNLLKFAKLELAACKEQLKAKDDLLKSKDEQLKLSMVLVASKDELAKAKQAPKGQALACITNA